MCPERCKLVVRITAFSATRCVPTYLLIPGVGGRQRLGLLSILRFTDVGLEAQRRSRRRDFCRETTRLICNALNLNSLQPAHTCEKVDGLFRAQAGQAVMEAACLLHLKTS